MRPGAISRRQFVVGAGASSATLLAGCGRWPGQPKPSVYRVGWLGGDGTASWLEPFRQGMREQGYIEGENLMIVVRTTAHREEELPTLATELAGLSLDAIVADTPPAAVAARNATSGTPIVFGVSSDPIGEGLVASFARPGGNLTGQSAMNRALSGKRVELLVDSVPALSRLGILRLFFPGVGSELDAEEARVAARTLGIEQLPLEARSGHDLDGLFQTAARQQVGAVLVLPGTTGQAARIAELALAYGLPTMCPQRDFVTAGNLMSYGPNFPALLRRTAYYVDRILKGSKPADLPVEQPTTFDFAVNLRTAQALGITFPNEIMLQVTEVIE